MNILISEQIVYLHDNKRHISSFAANYPNVTTVSSLKFGRNKSTLILKVLCDAVYSVPPTSHICMDVQGQLVMVCFYNIADAVRYFKINQIITIRSPLLFKRQEYSAAATTSKHDWNVLRTDIPIIQVFDLKSILIDGAPFPDELIVPTVLKSILISDEQPNRSSDLP